MCIRDRGDTRAVKHNVSQMVFSAQSTARGDTRAVKPNVSQMVFSAQSTARGDTRAVNHNVLCLLDFFNRTPEAPIPCQPLS